MGFKRWSCHGVFGSFISVECLKRYCIDDECTLVPSCAEPALFVRKTGTLIIGWTLRPTQTCIADCRPSDSEVSQSLIGSLHGPGRKDTQTHNAYTTESTRGPALQLFRAMAAPSRPPPRKCCSTRGHQPHLLLVEANPPGEEGGTPTPDRRKS